MQKRQNKKFLLVDFEDSFTFNLSSELAKRHLNHDVILWKQLNSKMAKNYDVFIWGPGPGHPNDYIHLMPFLFDLVQRKKTFHFGVCLGHQLLWALNGAIVKKSQRPIHGQSRIIKIPYWPGIFLPEEIGLNTRVQHYNSLIVSEQNKARILGRKVFGVSQLHNELIMSYGEGILTYQFHPESLGTSFPHIFFGAFQRMVYNDCHGPEAYPKN